MKYCFRSFGWIGVAAMAVMTLVFSSTTSNEFANRDGFLDGEIVVSLTSDMMSIDLNDAYPYQRIAIASLHTWDGEPGRSSDDAAYAVANQPGQNWRSVVDAYQHIDPGRRMI